MHENAAHTQQRRIVSSQTRARVRAAVELLLAAAAAAAGWREWLWFLAVYVFP